ncbi:MAG TPA: glycosyltransferase family 25 protein [Bauldia sp.]|nr:glycosyltransferase family 25 protein [Bauldia sp.]
MNRIPVLVVSLRRSETRRREIAGHLLRRGVDFTFFDAVEGGGMSAADLAAFRARPTWRFGTPLLAGEIGVAATYRSLAERIAAGEHEHVCILEDDAVLDPAALALLDPDCLAALPPFDLLRIGHGGMRWPRRYVTHARREGFTIIAPVFTRGLFHAQIVSRRGAARIAAGLVPLRGAVDTMLFDDSLIPSLRILQTKPSLARQNSAHASTVARPGERVPAPEHVLDRAKRTANALAAGARSVRNFAGAWGFVALVAAIVRADRSASSPRS